MRDRTYYLGVILTFISLFLLSIGLNSNIDSLIFTSILMFVSGFGMILAGYIK